MKNLEAIDEIVERFERSAEFERANGKLSECQEFKQIAEWLKELKEYKEQQPCDDAISREFLMQDLLLKAQGEKDVSIKWLENYINSLSTVTPKQKTGKWNVLGRDDPDCVLYRCSECHMKITLKFNYCPNCGAKMESEE